MMTDNESQSRRSLPGSLVRIFKAPEWGLVAGILFVLAVIYFLDRDRAFFREVQHSTVAAPSRALRRACRRRGRGDHRRRDRSVDRGRRRALVGRQCQATDRVAADRWQSRCGRHRFRSWSLAIGLTLLMGLAIGLLHALMINGLRIPPFIATLATMAGLRSLATILCQNRTINVSFDAYRVLGKEAWVTLSIFSCVAVFMSILMGWHRAGPPPLRPGGQRDGRAVERPADESPEGRRLRSVGDAVGARRDLVHGLQRPGRQPPGHDLRADRHHGGGGRWLQSFGRASARSAARSWGCCSPRSCSRGRASSSRASTAPRSRGSSWVRRTSGRGVQSAIPRLPIR